MGMYRSASFFGGLYAPHITNGMPTQEEVLDIGPDDYRVIDTVATAEQEQTAESKPAGRPKGVHAAIKAKAAPKEEKPTDVAPEAQTAADDGHTAQSADTDDATTDGDDANSDMFDAPGDDDYEPA
ncbi:hypothetical protein ACQKHB_23235, partial [Escherichia coli]|uniref:hypothetical protein n=1 Tax=Escherichia coli TaxID=562 RepID=UPI003CFF3F61